MMKKMFRAICSFSLVAAMAVPFVPVSAEMGNPFVNKATEAKVIGRVQGQIDQKDVKATYTKPAADSGFFSNARLGVQFKMVEGDWTAGAKLEFDVSSANAVVSKRDRYVYVANDTFKIRLGQAYTAAKIVSAGFVGSTVGTWASDEDSELYRFNGIEFSLLSVPNLDLALAYGFKKNTALAISSHGAKDGSSVHGDTTDMSIGGGYKVADMIQIGWSYETRDHKGNEKYADTKLVGPYGSVDISSDNASYKLNSMIISVGYESDAFSAGLVSRTVNKTLKANMPKANMASTKTIREQKSKDSGLGLSLKASIGDSAGVGFSYDMWKEDPNTDMEDDHYDHTAMNLKYKHMLAGVTLFAGYGTHEKKPKVGDKITTNLINLGGRYSF